MARRRKNRGPAVSLFPFLSILACIIGTLTLLITVLALGQMDNSTVHDAQRFEQVRSQHATEQLAIARLEAKLAHDVEQASTLERQLNSVREELARLKADQEAAIARRKELLKELERGGTAAGSEAIEVQLTEQLAKLAEQIKQLEVQLAARKKPPEEATVRIRPGGSGVDLQPTFVECAAGSIVIYEGKQPNRVVRAGMEKNPAFLALLDRVAGDPKRTVVFLLRPDGLGSYYAAAAVARSRYAHNGKLPVPSQGKIDLSMFKK